MSAPEENQKRNDGMIHRPNFLIRKVINPTEKAHIYPCDQITEKGGWYSWRSICGNKASLEDPAEPGDGTPVCKKCARMAGKKGWIEE